MQLAATSAPLVTIVPTLMSWTFIPESGRTPEDWIVPTSRLLGVDFYNQSELSDLVTLVRDVAGLEIPIIAPELGCRADPTDPARAASWMRAAFDASPALGVVGLAWFDSPHAKDPDLLIDDEMEQAMLRRLLWRTEVARLNG